MYKFGVALLIITLTLEDDLQFLPFFTPQSALGFTTGLFITSILALAFVKNTSEDITEFVVYSDKYKSQVLIKNMAIGVGIALSIDVFIAYFLESTFWVYINPFDSNYIFLVLLFISFFRGSLKIEFLNDFVKLKCSRLGFVTSNISDVNDLTLTKSKLIILTHDNGKYTFHLDRFSMPMREILITTCVNMPNKPLKRD